MCGNCDGIVIPVGPAGPQGVQGPIGLTGPQGIQGIQGIQGVPGNNAFKVIKQYYAEEIEQTITITQDELTNCDGVPAGCFIAPAMASFADIHIQVWCYIDGPLPYWQLLTNSTVIGTYNVNCKIDGISGDITVTTGNLAGMFRIVILG